MLERNRGILLNQEAPSPPTHQVRVMYDHVVGSLGTSFTLYDSLVVVRLAIDVHISYDNHSFLEYGQCSRVTGHHLQNSLTVGLNLSSLFTIWYCSSK